MTNQENIDKAVTELTQPKPAPRPVAVGDIFEMSWGYDQTNVNYFQVTRLTAKGVYVREIGCETVPGSEGFMSCKVKPVPGKFLARSQWCTKRTWNEAGNIPTSTDSANPETFRKLAAGRFMDEIYFSFEGRYYAHRISADASTYNSWYA